MTMPVYDPIVTVKPREWKLPGGVGYTIPVEGHGTPEHHAQAALAWRKR